MGNDLSAFTQLILDSSTVWLHPKIKLSLSGAESSQEGVTTLCPPLSILCKVEMVKSVNSNAALCLGTSLPKSSDF